MPTKTKTEVRSYKPEVIADNSGKWSSNMLRFADPGEAEAYLKDLEWRWTSVREIRVVASDEPANARWIDGQVKHEVSDG